MNKSLTVVGYASLVALLALELVLRYDTWVRQIALAITNVATVGALLILHQYMRKRGTTLPWLVVWFAALGVWFDGMGNFLHFYANISWWDDLAHAVGTGALTAGIAVLVELFQKTGIIVLGPKLRVLFVISVATTLSVVYEISEYIGDTVYPTNRVTGIFDTASDLLWNMVAAVFIACIAYRISARSNRRV
jgi:hypothetical protein